jgi:hypothetical protein
MKTSRLTLNKAEVAAVLPGLEAIVNAIGNARMGHFPRLDPRVQFPSVNRSTVYSQAESDETMAGQMLTARNKLKEISGSRKVRLNCFELAAIAFALRLAQREELAPEDVLAKVPGLADKLENYRKRAKRAAIKDIGTVAYKEQAERWGRFLQWMRCILCYRPTLWKSSALPVFHRDRREMLFARATEVAPAADPALLLHLADLAKREILRDRHPVTLGMLVSDDGRGRDFMASFLLSRIDPELLTPEFQPLCILQSAREEQLKKALVFDADDEPLDEVQVVAGQIAEGPRTGTEVPAPSVENLAKAPDGPLVSDVPKTLPTQQKLAEHYAGWLLGEADPEYWPEINRQIQHLAWNFTRRYVRETTSRYGVGEMVSVSAGMSSEDQVQTHFARKSINSS